MSAARLRWRNPELGRATVFKSRFRPWWYSAAAHPSNESVHVRRWPTHAAALAYADGVTRRWARTGAAS